MPVVRLQIVIPAKAGIHAGQRVMDSGSPLRSGRNDDFCCSAGLFSKLLGAGAAIQTLLTLTGAIIGEDYAWTDDVRAKPHGCAGRREGHQLIGHTLLGGLIALLQLWLVGALLGLGLGEVLSRAGQGLAAVLNAIPSWFS